MFNGNKNTNSLNKNVAQGLYNEKGEIVKYPNNYFTPDKSQIIIKIGKTRLKSIEDRNIKRGPAFSQNKDEREYSDDLALSLQSYTITESVSGSFDTCQLNFKMPVYRYQQLFGDGLDRIQTGQWIILQKQTEDLFEDKQAQIDNMVKFNQNNLENYKQKLQKDKVFKNQMESVGRTSTDAQSQDVTPKNSYDFFDEYKDVEQKKMLDQLNLAASPIVASGIIQDYHVGIQSIFIGIISDINSELSIEENTGIPMFNVSIIGQSFIYPLQSNEILYGTSALKYTQLGNYDKNPNFKYKDVVNAIFKNGEYWEKFGSQFLSRITKIEKDNKKIEVIDLRQTMTDIMRSFTRNILPPIFYEYLPNEVEVLFDKIDNSEINPGGYPVLGLLINIVTEQQHLPMNSVYRQFLPIHAPYATNLQGFKTALGSNSIMQTWSLLTGTFLTDPALFDFFPILVPLNNFTEIELKIQKNRVRNVVKQYYSDIAKIHPEFNPGDFTEVIYNIWIQLGAIPCVVFRWKLLNPEFSLNNKNYVNLIANQGLFNMNYLEGMITNPETENRLKALVEASKNTSFKSEKICYLPNSLTFKKIEDVKKSGEDFYLINQDSIFADNLPIIDMTQIASWNQTNSENELINIVDVVPPRGGANIGSGSENSSLGVDERTVTNLYSIMLKGSKLLRSEYPLWDQSKALSNEFLGIIAERLYSIYAEGNKYQRGAIQINGDISHEILKGGWLRINMHTKNVGVKFEDTKYGDYYAYIESITRNHVWDANSGNYLATTIINYSRGRFGLLPTTFPDTSTSRIGSNNSIENAKETKGLTPNSKSNIDIIKELANNIEKGTAEIAGYETYSERLKAQIGAKIYNDYIRGGYAKYIKDNFNRDIKTRTQLKDARRELDNIENRSTQQQQELDFYEELLNQANRFEIDLNVKPYYEDTPQKNKSKIKKK